MKEQLLAAVRLTFICLVIFPCIYTGSVLLIAQAVPGRGHGEKVSEEPLAWYTNIGQQFTEDRYFWSRPSAVDYHADGSGGSNKGPSNPDYLALVSERIDTFLTHHPGVARHEVPVEMVTASGSGLDPHISPAAANVQASRIAQVRNLSEHLVLNLVKETTEKPWMGLFGPETVNVAGLNLALDKLSNQ